ncbi:MAG: tartrate dehydrogenase [Actinobacteria bacterium]|nr:tartrate dehydrogenase [Actinomycetota bacterium]
MTARYRVAAVPGDGIGGEVVTAAREVLDAFSAEGASTGPLIEWTEFDWGSDYYAQHGRMMPEDGLEQLRGFDALFFGAVGWPSVPDHISLWGLRLAICQGFDQWANVRPVTFLPGVPSPLRDAESRALDWIVIRENSEGEYAGIGGRNFSARDGAGEVAVQSSLFTERGCERIIRYAFEVAQSRPRHHLTSVTKSNAQQYGMVMWDEIFARVAKEYPGVTADSCLVDAMAARFVLQPEKLDVVVASNLNADILSDLGSALAGSLGLAASANLNPERRMPSMFEPVHGSAPDIAGTGVANPIGAISSAALMLDHLGEQQLGDRVRAAVAATTRDGVLTPDLGGTATTHDVVRAVIERLGDV